MCKAINNPRRTDLRGHSCLTSHGALPACLQSHHHSAFSKATAKPSCCISCSRPASCPGLSPPHGHSWVGAEAGMLQLGLGRGITYPLTLACVPAVGQSMLRSCKQQPLCCSTMQGCDVGGSAPRAQHALCSVPRQDTLAGAPMPRQGVRRMHVQRGGVKPCCVGQR